VSSPGDDVLEVEKRFEVESLVLKAGWRFKRVALKWFKVRSRSQSLNNSRYKVYPHSCAFGQNLELTLTPLERLFSLLISPTLAFLYLLLPPLLYVVNCNPFVNSIGIR
jgi:hypothetical protein